MAYNKLSRYQTKVTTHGIYGAVQYRQTVILAWIEDTIVLNTGGWMTVTTKRKLNQAAHEFGLDFGVYQKNHKWYVTTCTGETIEWLGGVLTIPRTIKAAA